MEHFIILALFEIFDPVALMASEGTGDEDLGGLFKSIYVDVGVTGGSGC